MKPPELLGDDAFQLRLRSGQIHFPKPRCSEEDPAEVVGGGFVAAGAAAEASRLGSSFTISHLLEMLPMVTQEASNSHKKSLQLPPEKLPMVPQKACNGPPKSVNGPKDPPTDQAAEPAEAALDMPAGEGDHRVPQVPLEVGVVMVVVVSGDFW